MEKSIEIDASPEKIWSMIQWDGTLEWYATHEKAEWTSKDKNKVGSTVHVTGKIADTKMGNDYETTELIKNEKTAFRSTNRDGASQIARLLHRANRITCTASLCESLILKIK